MSLVNQLQKRLAYHEGRVATLRVVIEELNADAVDRFPGKIRQAALMRASVNPAEPLELSHIKKPAKKKRRIRERLVFGRTVAGILGSIAMKRRTLLDTLHKQGLDGRGLGTMVKNKLMILHGGKYRLTQRGKAVYVVGDHSTLRSHGRKKKSKKVKTVKTKPVAHGPNGKGEASAYLAKLIAENGPMKAGDLLARAREDGKKVNGQTIGAAVRYKFIVPSGPHGDKNRTFSVPA